MEVEVVDERQKITFDATSCLVSGSRQVSPKNVFTNSWQEIFFKLYILSLDLIVTDQLNSCILLKFPWDGSQSIDGIVVMVVVVK